MAISNGHGRVHEREHGNDEWAWAWQCQMGVGMCVSMDVCLTTTSGRGLKGENKYTDRVYNRKITAV